MKENIFQSSLCNENFLSFILVLKAISLTAIIVALLDKIYYKGQICPVLKYVLENLSTRRFAL